MALLAQSHFRRCNQLRQFSERAYLLNGNLVIMNLTTTYGACPNRRQLCDCSNRVPSRNCDGGSRSNAVRCDAPDHNVSFGAYVRHLVDGDAPPQVLPESGIPSFDFDTLSGRDSQTQVRFLHPVGISENRFVRDARACRPLRAGQFANLAPKMRESKSIVSRRLTATFHLASKPQRMASSANRSGLLLAEVFIFTSAPTARSDMGCGNLFPLNSAKKNYTTFRGGTNRD